MTVKTHLSLNVRDVQRSTAWYAAFFDVAPHKIRDGYANFDLENPPLKLALNQSTSMPPLASNLEQADLDPTRPLNHLGLVVDSSDKVWEARRRLEAGGFITFTEENVTCCYARQDKIWVRDPDGNPWEVYTLVDDMPESAPKAKSCCE